MTRAPLPQIAPGPSVARSVQRHQLRRIIEYAEAGAYGLQSADILRQAKDDLDRLTRSVEDRL